MNAQQLERLMEEVVPDVFENPMDEARMELANANIRRNIAHHKIHYEIPVSLAGLRKAFDEEEILHEVKYIKMGEFEAATQSVQVINEEERGEYRLRIQLMNRTDLTFHLTPGMQKPPGTNLPPGTISRFADGLRLTDEKGMRILHHYFFLVLWLPPVL